MLHTKDRSKLPETEKKQRISKFICVSVNESVHVSGIENNDYGVDLCRNGTYGYMREQFSHKMTILLFGSSNLSFVW